MNRTKERRKAIQRSIIELATADNVPLAVRENELRNVAHTLQEAWGALHSEVVDDYGVWPNAHHA